MFRISNHFLKGKKTAGFTLMETLLVTAIIAVLTLSLYQALSNGLRVWERSRMLSVEEDIMIFFDKVTMDLRNAMDFSLFDFEGKPDKIIFSTIVYVPMGRAGASDIIAYSDQIGRVEYGIDSAHHVIYLRRANYGQAVEGDFGGKKILAQPVKRVTFRYFDRSENGLTVRKFGRKDLPVAVEVSAEYEDAQGDSRVLKRLINLPVFL